MRVIHGNKVLLERINSDDRLRVADFSEFKVRYDDINKAFHEHFTFSVARAGVENCQYHKRRYLDLLKEPLNGAILDVGNDKPFLSFWIRKLNPEAVLQTLSFDIPETPFDLYAVDIEDEPIPCEPGSVDKVLFVEVLEHLWRDPARAVYEMNLALKMGGEVYVTTPNACELHAVTCILWQANPNQRNAFYSALESGHLHLWTGGELQILFETNGFEVTEMTSFDAYGYTQRPDKLMELVRSITPHTEMMGESLLMRAKKSRALSAPAYDNRLFPSGQGVQFAGALKAFALARMHRQ